MSSPLLQSISHDGPFLKNLTDPLPSLEDDIYLNHSHIPGQNTHQSNPTKVPVCSCHREKACHTATVEGYKIHHEQFRLVQEQFRVSQELYKIVHEQRIMNHEQHKIRQDELVIQLRTQIGVLETELKQKENGVREGRQSLAHVVAALTGNRSPQTDSNLFSSELRNIVKEFKLELDSLKTENRFMREHIRRQEEAEIGGSLLQSMKSDGVGYPMGIDLQRQNFQIGGEGDTKVINERAKHFTPSFGPDFSFYEPRPEAQRNSELSSHGLSFAPRSDIVSNTMIHPVKHSSSVTNIGIVNLDDVLGDNLSDALQTPILPALRFPGVPNDFVKEGEKSIEEQMAEKELAFRKFHNMPRPGVLETGVHKSGARGKAYEAQEGIGFRSTENRHARLDFSGMSGTTLRYPENHAFVENTALYEELSRRGCDRSIWGSANERDIAIENWRCSANRNELHFPESFKYGVVHVPITTDNNIFRAVHVGNLPEGIELRDVLDRVRGGQIISAVLLDTFKMTGGLSALVTFIRESAAVDFVNHTAIHPLSFGEEDQKKDATVTLIATPTYPMSVGLINKLNTHGATRCLCIFNFTADFSIGRLERGISGGKKSRADNLVEMFFTPDKALHLQFSSVTAAGRAYSILAKWQNPHSLDIYYEQDPCAGSVEELLLEVAPRRPLFPREGFIDGSPASAAAYRDFDGGLGATEDVGEMQRKHFAALENQKIIIPDFSGNNLRSAPWADETDDEGEYAFNMTESSKGFPSLEPVRSKQNVMESRKTFEIHGINQKMGQNDYPWLAKEGLRMPLVGLQGSIYATVVSGFEHPGTGRKHSHSPKSVTTPNSNITNYSVAKSSSDTDTDAKKCTNTIQDRCVETSEARRISADVLCNQSVTDSECGHPGRMVSQMGPTKTPVPRVSLEDSEVVTTGVVKDEGQAVNPDEIELDLLSDSQLNEDPIIFGDEKDETLTALIASKLSA